MTHFVSFGHLEKKIGRFFKTAFYRAKGIVIRIILFFSIKTVLFPIFPDMELNFWNSDWRKLAVRPIFRPMCPGELFEENNVFKKTLFCFSDFERKTIRQGQKLLAAFFQRHIRCPEELLRMFLFLDFSGVFGQKFWGGVVKIAFQVSIKSFFWRKTLFGNFVKFFVQFRTLK